jgi:hypothetical protein
MSGGDSSRPLLVLCAPYLDRSAMSSGIDAGVDRVLLGQAERPSSEIENLRVNSRFDRKCKTPMDVCPRASQIGSPPPSATHWREHYRSSFEMPIPISYIILNK